MDPLHLRADAYGCDMPLHLGGGGSRPDCVSAPPVLLNVAFFLFVFSCGTFWLISWSFSALATVYVAVVLLGLREEARLSQFLACVM